VPAEAPKAPTKKALYVAVAFFGLSALGLFAGAYFTWQDEHTGIPGTAHITRCYHHTTNYGGLDCYATWTYKGRPASGYVENAKADQVGKDVSVRIHGTGHVTEKTLWVSIGLAVFALLEAAVGVMVVRQVLRRLRSVSSAESGH
jgi:hypothetical protein